MELVRARYKKPKIQRFTLNFKGLNNTARPEDGEITKGKNLKSDNSPCLSSRDQRNPIRQLVNNPNGFGSHNGKLYWVDGTQFWFNSEFKGNILDSPKTFLGFNDYLLIFPDKLYYDTINNAMGPIENTNTAGAGTLTFEHNKIVSTVAFTGFTAGDGITITGCVTSPVNNVTAVIKSMTSTEMVFNDNTFTAGTEVAAVITIKRSIPDIEFIAEHENRVWGVKGSAVYASKVGDFKNWNVFRGISTDSYAASVGSEGNFTGILKSPNHLALSKETCIHQVFGNKPENFEVGQAIPCVGVLTGARKSICHVNGTIYYLGSNGYIMGYAGGLPTVESVKLGKKYISAVAGSDGRKYYCNLNNGTEIQTFVMDTWQGNRWDPDDIYSIFGYTYCGLLMYELRNIPDRYIYGHYKSTVGYEAFPWVAETGPLYETVAEKQGNSEINVLADMGPNSILWIYKKLDAGVFTLVGTFEANTAEKEGLRTIKTTFPIEDCQYFKLQLIGNGPVTVHAIERVFYEGGRG